MSRITQTGDGNVTNNTSDIHSDLQAANQKIAELDQERKKLVIKRDALSQELSSQNGRTRQYAIQQASTLLPVSEKVALFKSLFKGREDIFSHRWQNSKGRSGYSVACNNEWVKGVCNKPRIKCNHLWIFFSESLPARDARLLGFGLLDKTMDAYPSLSFESYDRLFPSQDIMPDGGFGNLIALPLQHQARQKGYCQFVDENLQPYSDQWLFLSQIKTLSSKQLNDLLAQLKPKSQQAIETRMPWEQGTVVKLEKIERCPEQVTLTLANHIYIKLDDIPAPLAARFKRLASFSNPVFFKTQAMRFSTHGIPSQSLQ